MRRTHSLTHVSIACPRWDSWFAPLWVAYDFFFEVEDREERLRCFFAAFMLSTKLGYLRPARLAVALALDLLFAESLV